MLFLFCSIVSFGQTRAEKKGDRNFENYAYVDAIKLYESMADKGYINTSILSKLGDSYYFNGKLEEANIWYSQLFNSSYEDKNLSTLNTEYYYRYAQTLKAVNQLEQADAVLEQFNQLEAADTRALLFLTSNEIVEETKTASSFSLINLSLNSPHSDYGGTLLNNQFVFTSSRDSDEIRNRIHKWTNENYTKLYSSSILEDGTFETPVLFAKEIASKELNMGTAVFTKDGNTMYFTSNNGSTKGSKRAHYNAEEESVLKIYKASQQTDGTWGSVEELSINVEGFNTAHPALTPDEKWLYFASDRQGSIGQSDLFRVGIYDKGRFGNVEHLGDEVNTEGRETFPFISDENILYFSSDGHPGFGGLDLYKSKINLDGSLGVATNLGPDINSSVDDFGFFIDAQTKKGFFTSNRKGAEGGDDIYLFVEKACVQILNGIVSDKETQEILEGVSLVLSDRMQKEVGKVESNEEGFYSVNNILNCGFRYRIKASKEGYLTQEFVVDATRKAQQRLNIALEPDGTKIETGDDLFAKLKLEPIYFDFDKSDIRRDAQIELMKVVTVMLEYPELKIDVRSHTDSRGNDAYNMLLSERRAQSTIQWMMSQGIEANRLTGKGYGETQLLNACSNGIPCTDEAHQLNRRSEFIILNM